MRDQIDNAILKALQRDCRLSMAELGSEVGLSPSACHRRITLMQNEGVIDGYVARLNARKLGFTINFIVEVSLSGQSADALEKFESAVTREPDVLECFLMAGNEDYLLRIAATDTENFEQIHARIAHLPGVTRVNSKFVLRTVKPWSGFPI